MLKYPIHIATGLLKSITLEQLPKANCYVIITDQNVSPLYAEPLQSHLQTLGARVELLSITPGEASKSRQGKAMLEDAMLDLGCQRDTCILALGGGVVGDLAGYVAATYMRGIPFVQMPTTLLAMVDSSVGGKTAINAPAGKNLIGAFYPPQAVFADLNTLKTLPKEELQNGLIEALKMFITHDAESLQLDHKNTEEIIKRAVAIKAAVVERDEKEKGERATLNLGHTVGHALEKLSEFKLKHGYAVGLGILVEAKMDELEGELDPMGYATIEGLMEAAGVNPADINKYSLEQIQQAMQSDKKAKEGVVNRIVLKALGEAKSQGSNWAFPVDYDTLSTALNYFKNKFN